MGLFWGKGASGFSSSSTAEEVTYGIDATGLTAIVTGASSGIGAETARVLSMRGAYVILGVRNLAAGNKTKAAILNEIPMAKVDVIELELSSMASVKKNLSQNSSPPDGIELHFATNHAGVCFVPYELSVDGIELHFATNHVGHFLLTDFLLDTMKETSRKSGIEGRIVNISSVVHKALYSKDFPFEKINDKFRRITGRWQAYCRSKLANVLHANELSRRLAEEGANVTSNSLHPGAVRTNLLQKNPSLETIVNFFGKMFMKDVQQGAATTCYVALHPQMRGVTGEYLSGCNLSKASAHARNLTMANKLWEFSMNLINTDTKFGLIFKTENIPNAPFLSAQF